MSGYQDFSFGEGDDNLSAGKFDRFKAKQGESYRLSCAWYPLEGGLPNFEKNPRFTGAKRWFIPNVGYVMDKGPEFAKLAGGPSKMAVATIVILWPLNAKGEVDKAQLANCKVMPWIFSSTTYDALARRNKEFPFGQHDIGITCTDTQYQKIDITPCRENLFAALCKNEKAKPMVEAILTKVAGIEANIQAQICTDMSLDKLREKMGGAAASPSFAPGGGGVAVDDLLDDILK